MKKILAALAASGVLVAGGFATAAISTPTSAAAQEAPVEEGTEDAVRPEKGAILDEVLGGLVTDGVITTDQAEQIKAALEAKHAELREQFGERRDRRGSRGNGAFRGLLQDGVIDADELAALPDDHPLKDPDGPAAEYLDDGQLTMEELRELRQQMREDRDAPAEDASADA